jgi:hypothetical protein
VGQGRPLHSDVAELALPRRRYRSVLAKDSRLVGGTYLHHELMLDADDRRAQAPCQWHGDSLGLALNDVPDYIDHPIIEPAATCHLGGVSSEQFEAAQKPW